MAKVGRARLCVLVAGDSSLLEAGARNPVLLPVGVWSRPRIVSETLGAQSAGCLVSSEVPCCVPSARITGFTEKLKSYSGAPK